MPKSGSTFLSACISRLPGFSQVHLVPTYGNREQELCVQTLVECERAVGPASYVAQHHVRYSAATALYLREFHIKPIMLVRNIFDVVPSLIDHHSIEDHVYPSAWAPADIQTRSFEAQASFVTQMAIPWYFNFYGSWSGCGEKLTINYDDLITAPEIALRRVCDHIGYVPSDGEIATAVAKANDSGARKNKVTPGRGKNLPSERIREIVRMATHYPDLDFTEIGITNDMRATYEKSLATDLSNVRVIWITGLPSSGKTTLARALKQHFDVGGIRSAILDGDELRSGLNSDLGFSDADREENVRRVAETAGLFARFGQIAIVAVVSPTPVQRALARRIIGDGFIEIFVDTPPEICESRDPKGNYRRAREGRIRDFTGVSAPYVRPEAPEVIVNPASSTVEQEVDVLLKRLRTIATRYSDGDSGHRE